MHASDLHASAGTTRPPNPVLAVGPRRSGRLRRGLQCAGLLCAGLLCAGLVLCAGPAAAADAADTLDRQRIRAGAWVGPSVINGLLQLRTDGANSDTSLDYLPAVDLGLELWPDPAIGTLLALQLGTGASISVPFRERTVEVNYNLYRFEAGARYRWYFGPRSNAPSLMVHGALRGRWQTVQEQRPISALVERIVAGPEAGLGFAWPVVNDRVWFRVSGRAGLPIFVREPGDDSGLVGGGMTYGGRLDVAVRVVGGWYVQLHGDLYDEELDFDGDGTRAAGVTGARTHDRYISGGLAARYAL